jgi:hypothetical protein
MPFSSSLIEAAPAVRASDIASSFFQSILGLPVLLLIDGASSILFKHRPECLALSLPLRHFFVSFFLLLEFFLDLLALLHELNLLFLDYAFSLCVELFTLALEHFLAYFFVFVDTVGIELATTASRTGDQITFVIFLQLRPIISLLFLEFTDRFLFGNFIPTRRSSLLLLLDG